MPVLPVLYWWKLLANFSHDVQVSIEASELTCSASWVCIVSKFACRMASASLRS